MANLELTVLARHPQLVLARAEALGLDRGDLLAASGFTEPELRDLDGVTRIDNRVDVVSPTGVSSIRPN